MTVPYTFANISGQIPLSELDANFAAVSAYVDTAGTVTASAQPNIASVGTLTTLTVAGNVTADYFLGNVVGSFSNAIYANTAGFATTAGLANIANIANSVAGANVSGTVANATYALTANISSYAGTVTTPAQTNITSVGNLTSLIVTGNSTVVNDSTVGANIVISGYANIGSYVSAVGNVTGNNFVALGSISTNNSVSAVGNVTGNNFVALGSISTNTNFSATGNVTGSGIIATSFVRLPTYTIANLTAITGSIGYLVALTDSNPIGSLAFWNGTGNAWSYVANSTPV